MLFEPGLFKSWLVGVSLVKQIWFGFLEIDQLSEYGTAAITSEAHLHSRVDPVGSVIAAGRGGARRRESGDRLRRDSRRSGDLPQPPCHTARRVLHPGCAGFGGKALTVSLDVNIRVGRNVQVPGRMVVLAVVGRGDNEVARLLELKVHQGR